MDGTAFASVEREIEENGAYVLKTSGASMLPLFKSGRDIVIVSKPTHPLKKYDVALYRGAGGRYILHRVIRVNEGGYVMRGDNTFYNESVGASDVVGVLTAFIRGDKRHEISELGYKFYSRLWHFIYPIRLFFEKCKRLWRKIFKKGKK